MSKRLKGWARQEAAYQGPELFDFPMSESGSDANSDNESDNKSDGAEDENGNKKGHGQLRTARKSTAGFTTPAVTTTAQDEVRTRTQKDTHPKQQLQEACACSVGRRAAPYMRLLRKDDWLCP